MYSPILRNNGLSKTLTLGLLFVVFSSLPAYSSILIEEKFSTHLRWNLYVDKQEVLITKTSSGFYIETFKLPLYRKLKAKLNQIITRKGRHFSRVVFNAEGLPKKPARIRVDLKDEVIELFSFYRPVDKKYILDFWQNDSELPNNQIPTKLADTKTKAASPSVILPRPGPRPIKEQEYRDFRYGAALIWDYPSLSPKIEQQINIERKTPEYFYPVKDRNLDQKDDRLAHLQLNINLYRKNKYGLMAKSIGLYQKKYGRDENYDFNEYLKALALIKENLKRKDEGPFRKALAILSHITDRTKDYDLKKAIYLYRIQYLMESKNMIEVLQTGKRLYVESKIESDSKTLNYAAEVILYTLSQLGQVEKVRKFSSEKSVKKLVAPQTLMAYEIFVLHKEKQIKQVIDLFHKNKSRMQKPIDPSILYNVAEAYFRQAQYIKAIRVYRSFLKSYAHTREGSYVRVRLALSHELLENDLRKTVALYEDAINYSSDIHALYEAKLRYVAIRNTRKREPSKNDQKILSFLKRSSDESIASNNNLKTLLWIVRLRTFINLKDYQKALSYITALPIQILGSAVKKMFKGDGAEIVYGMMMKSFERNDFSRVVKLWEIYQDIYENNVAASPYLSFVVAQSYINLGLKEGSDRIISRLKKLRGVPHRTFPIWVPRINYGNVDNLVAEVSLLGMLRQKNWRYIIKNIDNLNVTKNRKLFYEIISLFQLKYFDQAIKAGEEFLRNTPAIIPLSKNETQQFFEAYLESLYANSNIEKFKRAAAAVLKDIEQSKASHKGLEYLSEKINYLLIETLYASSKKEERIQVEDYINKFLRNYKNSIYIERVRFLLASHFIKNQKKVDGLKILNELVASENVSDYIKEIAKMEITNIKLDEKTIN